MRAENPKILQVTPKTQEGFKYPDINIGHHVETIWNVPLHDISSALAIMAFAVKAHYFSKKT